MSAPLISQLEVDRKMESNNTKLPSDPVPIIVAWTFGPGRTCKGVGPGSELEIRRSVQLWSQSVTSGQGAYSPSNMLTQSCLDELPCAMQLCAQSVQPSCHLWLSPLPQECWQSRPRPHLHIARKSLRSSDVTGPLHALCCNQRIYGHLSYPSEHDSEQILCVHDNPERPHACTSCQSRQCAICRIAKLPNLES